MATHTITFDPTSGVAYGANLSINTGATFSDSFTVKTTSGSAFNFDGWTASSQMTKSVSVGSSMYAAATFNVGFTSAVDGKFNISLGSTETRSLVEGRYVYNILVSSGSTIYNLASGNILVIPGISSAP
jgi:hypothetical protein